LGNSGEGVAAESSRSDKFVQLHVGRVLIRLLERGFECQTCHCIQ
jgi:hypothetical protein